MQFQIPLALLALLVGVQAAPATLDARFKVTGFVDFCSAAGDGPFGGNGNGCADVVDHGKGGGFTQLACVSAQTATTITLNTHNPGNDKDLAEHQSCPNQPIDNVVCGAKDGSFAVKAIITPPGGTRPKTCEPF